MTLVSRSLLLHRTEALVTQATAATAIGWGQEEAMDEDTAAWKEGVRVRSFMEAQKGKKDLIWKIISPQ